MGAARGTTGSRGPGHLWVPQEVEGRGRAAESGVFLWVVVGSSKKREEAGEGSRTHPQAQTLLQLGAPGWGGAGLGEGERDSQGCSSSGLLRRPRQCRGRGSRRREGKRERGRAGPTPHASTRTALAHPQITARPAGSGAQAQEERPRGGSRGGGAWPVRPAAGYSRAARERGMDWWWGRERPAPNSLLPLSFSSLQ